MPSICPSEWTICLDPLNSIWILFSCVYLSWVKPSDCVVVALHRSWHQVQDKAKNTSSPYNEHLAYTIHCIQSIFITWERRKEKQMMQKPQMNRIKESCKMIKNSIRHLSTISGAFLGLLQPIRGNDFHTLRSEQFSYLIRPPGPCFLHQDLITLMKVLFKRASWLKTNAYIIRVAAGPWRSKERNRIYTDIDFMLVLCLIVLTCICTLQRRWCMREREKARERGGGGRSTWRSAGQMGRFHTNTNFLKLQERGRKKKRRSYISKCRNVSGWCANRLFSFWKVSGLFLTPCVSVKGTLQTSAIRQTVYSAESLQMGSITLWHAGWCCLV